MNRYKKEEQKRIIQNIKNKIKPIEHPPSHLSQEEWFDLINYYEDTTHDERLKKSLAPNLKHINRRSKELKDNDK